MGKVDTPRLCQTCRFWEQREPRSGRCAGEGPEAGRITEHIGSCAAWEERCLCPRCLVPLKQGVALVSTLVGGFPDFPGGEVVTLHEGGSGRLVDAWKCPKCGYSRRR